LAIALHTLDLTVSLYLETYKNTRARRGDKLKGSDHNSKFLLTNREREVFELLVQDKTTKDIAQQLFISEKTVRNHISNVMQKLNVKGRSQAVVELIKLGELKI
jgi:LuxR family transcriptional regulator, transcriptional regulator of spore coat protein